VTAATEELPLIVIEAEEIVSRAYNAIRWEYARKLERERRAAKRAAR
jgi:hypothetical protein